MRRARQALLVVLFFVCPLVFFTNLTRNPYVTQICLLNLALLLAAALWGGWDAGAGAALPRTPLDAPLAGWVLVCVLSWTVAYLGHGAFFRPAMRSEGLSHLLFVLINCVVPFYLSASLGRENEQSETPLGPWIGFALIWGLLWSAFPQMRGPAGTAPAEIWSHVWDGYGAFVWAAGLAGALWLTRRAQWIDFLHLLFATAFLASVYGVLQYFNVDFIWPNVLNPYGGRSVSTFGNPNFMSSYDVVVLPLAVLFFARSRGGRRLAYGALALAIEAALLCSLTRSSWLGAAVGIGLLLLCAEFRRALSEDAKPCGLFFAAAAAMALMWPQSTIASGYTPSVIGRITEIGALVKHEGAYSPWHQRLLIWTCGWLMGSENPLTGKGWGLFELYYPFYQGFLLDSFDFYRSLRTHANNAHNELIEIWAQTGIAGVGVMAWLWAAFLASIRPLLKRARAADAVCVAAAAGAVGMLADNLLNVSLHFAVPAFTFWWIAGLAMSGPARSQPERAVPRPAALAVGLAALISCSYWVRTWQREAWYFAGFKLLRQAQAAPSLMPTAVRALETSKNWGPPEVNAIYELGNAYARSERFPDAAAAYADALRANSGYDEIYYNLGALNSSRLGKMDAAIDDYRISWWINPISPDIYNSLGSIYLQNPTKYLSDAIALLERAVHFFPANPNHWNNLGYLYTTAKRYPQAQKAYEQALMIDPSLSLVERNLAALAQQEHKPPPRILAELASLRELDARVAKREFSDETLALASRVAAALPEMPKARFLLGSLLLLKQRPSEAAAHLEWVVSRQPGQAVAYINLGQAYMALGRPADAAAQFRAALSVEPENPQAKQLLEALSRR